MATTWTQLDRGTGETDYANARLYEAKNYRVPPHLVAWAQKEAEQRRRTTGESITWSQVIREALECVACVSDE